MPEKKLYDLTVDPEFRDLIPPLNEEELKLLEESLVADGCESPLIVWNGVIVDGHNRYAICRKHEIPFAIQEKNFSSRDDAMLWMLRNQLGRRNLNNYQRVELVLKFEPLVKNAAEQRMMAGKAANPVPTLAQGQTKGRTRDHLSEAAGVSHGTFAKAKKLVQSADEETKRELRAGKVTVNRAYTDLLEKEHEGETKICERCKQEKPLSAFSIPSNRRSFSSVCRDCEKEISAVAKSAAEAAAKPADTAAKPADIAASSEPPCPIPGMVMHNGAPIHVERPLPDTPEMFRYVADLVKSCCEEDAFINGNGTAKPTGLLHSVNGAATGVTTAGAAITADEIIDLIHSVKSGYRKKAVFLLNDSTVKTLRRLKDGNGQYLWQPGLKEGQPDKLLSYRLVTSAYMPEVASGAKPVLFGDFSSYWIADRQGRSFQRLNELYAATGQIGFRATQRVDGRLVQSEGLKCLAMKA